jgi:N-acetylmuramoyl-L-alanine amidase
VDAGHGNHDAGARGVNGTYEKNVNLAIATKLADSLRDAGANVLMTRTRDTFIPVNQRPAIAGKAGADFFLSVHSDSTDSGPRLRGSTVYFHGADPNCRALAKCIANRFEQMGGIPSRGVRTDFVRFPGEGYGVLRNARMTAVLIECGFMTNPSDVKMLNDKVMQTRIAEAITDGLRDYIEGNPDADSRNNNPKVKAQGPIQIQAPAPTGSSAEPVTPVGEPNSEPSESPEVNP